MTGIGPLGLIALLEEVARAANNANSATVRMASVLAHVPESDQPAGPPPTPAERALEILGPHLADQPLYHSTV